MKKTIFVFCFITAIGALVIFLPNAIEQNSTNDSGNNTPLAQIERFTPEIDGVKQILPPRALLDNGGYYTAQTFNNCAPVALSMALSYYGIHKDQQTLADILRPTNNKTGKNDDKSTPPYELAAHAETLGLVAYFRPAGSLDLLKRLIAAGYPVITRTLLIANDDFAHYRVIKGYDDARGEIIDDDGYQGENFAISYDNFLALWKPFNYGYLVLTRPEKRVGLESILGQDVDARTAWRAAAQIAEQALAADPNDATARFNLSVADYYLGDYAGSVKAFEAIEPSLTEHVLWYQIEPIAAYYELGDYDKVFSLAQSIFSNNNPVYPELHVLEGKSYLKKSDVASARTAFETALNYNKNLKGAQDALASLGSQ